MGTWNGNVEAHCPTRGHDAKCLLQIPDHAGQPGKMLEYVARKHGRAAGVPKRNGCGINPEEPNRRRLLSEQSTGDLDLIGREVERHHGVEHGDELRGHPPRSASYLDAGSRSDAKVIPVPKDVA